jgi:hypothetical protein
MLPIDQNAHRHINRLSILTALTLAMCICHQQ